MFTNKKLDSICNKINNIENFMKRKILSKAKYKIYDKVEAVIFFGKTSEEVITGIHVDDNFMIQYTSVKNKFTRTFAEESIVRKISSCK